MTETPSEPSPRSVRSARRARKKRRLLTWIIAGVALTLLVVLAKPAYRLFKFTRANQLSAEAEAFVDQGKYNEAAAKYRAALQLDKLGYRPLRGAAQLATRLGRPEAVHLWEQVMRTPQATPSDRQACVALLLEHGRFETAERHIRTLLRVAPDTRTLILAGRYAQRTGDIAKAIEFARAAVAQAGGDEAAKMFLAEVLAASSDAAHHKEARDILWSFAGQEKHRSPALTALAKAPDLSADEKERLLAAYDALPDPSAMDRMFAADLRLQLHPDMADRVFDELVAHYRHGSVNDLVELSRWLNLKKQPQRVLDLITAEKASESSDLLISRLDALAAAERWDEIEGALNEAERLDPAALESFRARLAQARNNQLDATLHWNRAVAQAGNNPSRLRFVANYAEQSGNLEAAQRSYEQLTKHPEQAAFAYRGLQRVLDRKGDTAGLKAVSERLASVAPDDPDALNQSAYTNLLLNHDVEENAATAQELVKKYPARLAFRVTAALAALRQHDAGRALEQFAGPAIEWERTPPEWRAVYAAALMANEQQAKARSLIATIPLERLKPEERKLIEPTG